MFVKPSPVRGCFANAVGVKLRRVGLIAFASAAPTVLSVAGRRDAGVVWAEGFTFRLEGEDDWVGIAPGPSEARAGPPHEVLSLLFAIHAPPFWGARESDGASAGYQRGWVSDVRLSGS